MKTARDIAANVTPKEGTPPRVVLDATVTFQDPTLTIFLRDESGVTFIRGAKDNPRFVQGDRLHVEGVTHNGLIIGGIKPSRIECIGGGEKVEPVEVTPDDLASGKYHYHWVTMRGVGRVLQLAGENSATLRLNTSGKTVELRFDEAPVDAKALLDAELRVRGLAAGDINDRRQIVQPYLRVRSMDDVEITKPASQDAFEAAPLRVGELQRANPQGHRVKLRGVALGPVTGGGLFLRDEDRAVFVQTDPLEVKAGDVVDALGFVEMGFFSAQLADAECRVAEHGAEPQALVVGTKELGNGTDAELIQTEARVLQRIERGDAVELVAQQGTITLNIIAPRDTPREVQTNAQLRVTGLARVTATKGEGYRARPTAYNVWLRRLDDLVLLQRAPWWTAQRLALGLAGVAVISLLAFAWIVLLRRQVAKQLVQIQSQAQAEAVHEERQRIAREFHDTLEQELAGLSLRLDAAATRVTDEKARALLEQQRKLLTRLQSETRDFVWDLRDPSRNDLPLDEALRSLLAHLQSGTTMPLVLSADALPQALPPLVQHHLLRIAREAVNNAIKYSGAKSVNVRLAMMDGKLQLSVSDDGAGFDVSQADALEGHFGIRGMRERARRINATLNIESTKGVGTRVELTLPLPAVNA